jgi:serine/threonine protein phosphatase PrpC
MEVAVTTDAGHAGRHNEDAWCAEQLHRNVTLLAVADGFGRIHGAPAASIALDSVNESVRRDLQAAVPPRSLTGADVRDILVSAFEQANHRLLQSSGGSDDQVNAASTCTAVLIVSNQAFIAHVGDARAYLFRRGELVQLTSDESLVPEFVTSSGGVSRLGRYRPVRPVLMRALGVDAEPDAPKVSHYTLHQHDSLLLCTDGAHRPLTAADLQHALAGRDHAAEWVTDRILTLSRAAGSVDNSTVLLAREATEHGSDVVAKPPPKPAARSLVAVLSALVAAALLCVSLVWTEDTKFYLSVDPSGRVTLYSGLPLTIAGMPLHSTRMTFDVRSAALPDAVQLQLADGIAVSTPASAASLVNAWQAKERH